MKLAIIGSREASAIDIASHLTFAPDMIISGGARGIDTYAREYAIRNNIPLKEYLPEYGRFGRKAPLFRDMQIVDNSDFILAFWNGRSRGTKFTLDYAERCGVPFKIIDIP